MTLNSKTEHPISVSKNSINQSDWMYLDNEIQIINNDKNLFKKSQTLIQLSKKLLIQTIEKILEINPSHKILNKSLERQSYYLIYLWIKEKLKSIENLIIKNQINHEDAFHQVKNTILNGIYQLKAIISKQCIHKGVIIQLVLTYFIEIANCQQKIFSQHTQFNLQEYLRGNNQLESQYVIYINKLNQQIIQLKLQRQKQHKNIIAMIKDNRVIKKQKIKLQKKLNQQFLLIKQLQQQLLTIKKQNQKCKLLISIQQQNIDKSYLIKNYIQQFLHIRKLQKYAQNYPKKIKKILNQQLNIIKINQLKNLEKQIDYIVKNLSNQQHNEEIILQDQDEKQTIVKTFFNISVQTYNQVQDKSTNTIQKNIQIAHNYTHTDKILLKVQSNQVNIVIVGQNQQKQQKQNQSIINYGAPKIMISSIKRFNHDRKISRLNQKKQFNIINVYNLIINQIPIKNIFNQNKKEINTKYNDQLQYQQDSISKEIHIKHLKITPQIRSKNKQTSRWYEYQPLLSLVTKCVHYYYQPHKIINIQQQNLPLLNLQQKKKGKTNRQSKIKIISPKNQTRTSLLPKQAGIKNQKRQLKTHKIIQEKQNKKDKERNLSSSSQQNQHCIWGLKDNKIQQTQKQNQNIENNIKCIKKVNKNIRLTKQSIGNLHQHMNNTSNNYKKHIRYATQNNFQQNVILSKNNQKKILKKLDQIIIINKNRIMKSNNIILYQVIQRQYRLLYGIDNHLQNLIKQIYQIKNPQNYCYQLLLSGIDISKFYLNDILKLYIMILDKCPKNVFGGKVQKNIAINALRYVLSIYYSDSRITQIIQDIPLITKQNLVDPHQCFIILQSTLRNDIKKTQLFTFLKCNFLSQILTYEHIRQLTYFLTNTNKQLHLFRLKLYTQHDGMHQHRLILYAIRYSWKQLIDIKDSINECYKKYFGVYVQDDILSNSIKLQSMKNLQIQYKQSIKNYYRYNISLNKQLMMLIRINQYKNLIDHILPISKFINIINQEIIKFILQKQLQQFQN